MMAVRVNHRPGYTNPGVNLLGRATRAILFLHLAFITAGAAAQPPQTGFVVNRAVLTAGREIYTAADAVGILVAWNVTRTSDEKPAALTTDWLNELPVGGAGSGELLTSMQAWPDDLRLFFQCALIWMDVQKLNLFVAREQDVALNVKKMNEVGKEAFGTIPEVLVGQVQKASPQTKKRWIESVMRIRSFIRVRGALDKNRNLFAAGWYWHKSSIMGPTNR